MMRVSNSPMVKITPGMMAFLGPRLDVLYRLVMAPDSRAFASAWPLAREALFRQGVDFYDLKVTDKITNEKRIQTIKKSILERVKPSFTKSLNSIAEAEPPARHIAIKIEMIELGALQTFADVNLIEQAVVTKFNSIDYEERDSHEYMRPFMEDVQALQQYLENPITSSAAAEDLVEIFEDYLPSHYWSDLFDSLSDDRIFYQSLDVDVSIFEAKHKRKDTRRKVLKDILCRSNEIMWHRVSVVETLRPALEHRLMHEVMSGEVEYTSEEIDRIYECGFISKRIYDAICS